MNHASQTVILVAPLHYRGLQRLHLQAVDTWAGEESDNSLNLPGTQRPRVVGLRAATVRMALQFSSHLSISQFGQMPQTGLGHSLPRDFHQGPLECGRGEGAHQCFRATRSYTGSESPPAVSRVSTSSTETHSLENAVVYINKRGGTRSPALTAQALELWAVALTAEVSLTAQHIPGIQNVVPDTVSRQIKTRTAWTLHRKIFQFICQRFYMYTPEVDLFASRLNHQVPKYVSRYPDPGALAVDAFLLDWSKWTYLIHPPVVLLPWVLRKIKED